MERYPEGYLGTVAQARKESDIGYQPALDITGFNIAGPDFCRPGS